MTQPPPTPNPYQQPSPYQQPPKKSRKKVSLMRRLTVGGLGLVAALLSGCGDDDDDQSTSAEPAALPKASEFCTARLAEELPDVVGEDQEEAIEEMVTVEDDGATVKIQTLSPYYVEFSNLAISTALCILEETSAPTDLLERFRARDTSTLGASGEEEYGENLSVSWSQERSQMPQTNYYDPPEDSVNFTAEFREG